MKKITLLAASLLLSFGMNAQILEEDFEDGVLPNEWEIISTHTNPDSNWQISMEEGGNHSPQVLYSDPSMMDEWLITPSLDLSAETNVELAFDFLMSYHWMVIEDGADLFVKVSTDGGTTWDQLWREEDAAAYFNSTEQNFIWIEAQPIDLSSYDGESDVTIAFHFLGNDGAQTRVDNVVVSGALGTSENDINGFSKFYNSQSKNLTIAANENFSNISMFNVLGQQVLSRNLSSSNEVINLSNLKDGVYIVNVTASGNTTTFKIVKR